MRDYKRGGCSDCSLAGKCSRHKCR
ncbi:MAG: hypothetical protein LUE15_08695 [Oscillospiraceae bacterium]|nr:hypothetical protein [Oscillospiraceae bacterium]